MIFTSKRSFADGSQSSAVWILIMFLWYKFGISYAGLDLDINDLLSSRMMPLELLLLELDKHEQRQYKPAELYLSGNISEVLQTMDYHRHMMQQFMASSFLTRQILNQTESPLIEKRMGKTHNETEILGHKSSSMQAPVGSVQKLLYDDGSAKYKAWLERTTTLEDIQQHMQANTNHVQSAPSAVRRQSIISEADSSAAGEEDFDEGDITGYAYDGANNASFGYNYLPQAAFPVPQWQPKSNVPGSYIKHVNKNGYESGYDDYIVHSSPPEHVHVMAQPPKQLKEISIKDITDIALTTLAFLSFGMFILQVLTCITMSKDDSSNLMMLPMEATEPTDPVDGVEEIRRRKRRSIPQQRAQLESINQLSGLVLNSIDNVLSIKDNKANLKHHYKFLCEYNSFGQKPSSFPRIWSPLWSLGVSWLAARVSNDYGSILKSLAHMYKVCT